MGVDLDGDGKAELVGVDRDGDGIIDEWECGNKCGFFHQDYGVVVAHEATCTRHQSDATCIHNPEAEGRASTGFFASLHRLFS